MKKTVVVLFGGYSTEHFVSCESAANIVRHIDEEKFDVLKIGLSLDGKWILTNASVEEIEDGTSWKKRDDNRIAIINPIRNSKSILILENGTYAEQHIDCVFPIIHGHGGEDGSIQGLLEMANIPYVGCGVAASACGMDKQLTRLFADFTDLKRPRSIDLYADSFELNKEEVVKLIDFNYPVFVKAANGGSSVGVIKVEKADDLYDAILEGFKFENKVLIEEGIMGREISATVIGNEDLEFGELCEIIIPENESFDYASKYINHTSSKQVPANLTDAEVAEIKDMAGKIYRALGCSNFSRIDFFINKDGEIYFNEINTAPGMRAGGIVPVVFEAQGIPFKEVITKLIQLSFDKVEQVHDVEEDVIRIR